MIEREGDKYVLQLLSIQLTAVAECSNVTAVAFAGESIDVVLTRSVFTRTGSALVNVYDESTSHMQSVY